jgi:Ser/Thr protein kinase RdoA (MazF antagonist)
LVGDAGSWFIDFDDCMLAWPVQDLGVTMWEVGEDEAAWPYREVLREGYEGVVPWPERWAGEIDIFAADRGLIKIGGQVHQRAGTDRAELHASVQRHAAAISWYLDHADALR